MSIADKFTGHGRPEATKYDRVRHESMKLRPIGYGYFPVNRTLSSKPICCVCEVEIDEPLVRFINKKPCHRKCFLKDAKG